MKIGTTSKIIGLIVYIPTFLLSVFLGEAEFWQILLSVSVFGIFIMLLNIEE